MNVEQPVEWELMEETEVLGENLSQCHFVHHKSHVNWPQFEPRSPATNCLSYCTASRYRNSVDSSLSCENVRSYLRCITVSQVDTLTTLSCCAEPACGVCSYRPLHCYELFFRETWEKVSFRLYLVSWSLINKFIINRHYPSVNDQIYINKI
jgi:hypothetical protein